MEKSWDEFAASGRRQFGSKFREGDAIRMLFDRLLVIQDRLEKLEPAQPELLDSPASLDFDALYAAYPRKVGKARGMALCRSRIKSPKQYELLKRAVHNYARHVAGKDAEYIKHFSSFMASWTDYIEPEDQHTPMTMADHTRKSAEEFARSIGFDLEAKPWLTD